MNFLSTAYASVTTAVVNPVTGLGINNLPDLFAVVLNIIMALGVSLVVIMLAVGFVIYITSQGNKDNIEKAQKWLTYAVVGGVGLLFVFAIRTVMLNLVGGSGITSSLGSDVVF